MIEKVRETTTFLREKGFEDPEVGIILGTGLGGLTAHIDVVACIEYADIPHFPIATVEFHKGKLLYGRLEGKNVIVMQGRFHFYEGYNMAEVVFPVRVMKYLGIRRLLISNAGGCMNPAWKKGELMLTTDHINLQPDNPLRGREAAVFGPVFTDMSQPYDVEINQLIREVAAHAGIPLREGVYVAVSGPNLETRAEYRFLRMIGADVVGMSTVPEVIAANQMGLPVSAVSVLTDECDPENLQPVDIEDIIATAAETEKELIKIFKDLLNRF